MALFGNKKTSPVAKPVAAKKKAPVASKEDAVSMADLYGSSPVAKKTSVKENKAEKKMAKIETAKVLVKPLVTEKASYLASQSKYAFIVSDNANKIEVAKAVKAVYNVQVIKVNIINMEGKAVTRGRIKGRRSDFKKAIVTLKKGDTISIYEGV